MNLTAQQLKPGMTLAAVAHTRWGMHAPHKADAEVVAVKQTGERVQVSTRTAYGKGQWNLTADHAVQIA